MEFTNCSQARKTIGLSYLGNTSISAKLIKNKKINGVKTYCIYLAPSNISGTDVCPFASKECRMGCLNTSGRAKMESDKRHPIETARLKKTNLLVNEPEFFMNWLVAEIRSEQLKAKNTGFGFSVRLNGTSDVDYTKILSNGKNIFELFPEVIFYDYTKDYNRFNNMPANYHLTFSYTGRNTATALKLINKGFNVAVIFNVDKNKPLPKTFLGFEVIDGDITDYRIADKKGIIVGLRFKYIKDKNVNQKIKHSCLVVQTNDCQCTF